MEPMNYQCCPKCNRPAMYAAMPDLKPAPKGQYRPKLVWRCVCGNTYPPITKEPTNER